MEPKKRYLVGHSSSTIVPQDTMNRLDTFVAEQAEIKTIRKMQTGQNVLELTEAQAIELAESDPELVIEEDQELEMFLPMPALPPEVPAAAERTLSVKVVDEKTQKPIKDVTIFCIGAEVGYKGLTDKNGVAKIKILEVQLKRVIASPKTKYWSQYVAQPAVPDDNEITFKLRELPVSGNYNWGHLELGVDKVQKQYSGKGVKIAVIDSGIAKHEDVQAAGGFNTLDGQDTGAWQVDESGHGTHCAGVVAAGVNSEGIVGVAPEAETYVLKVFPGGRLSDMIEAINWCIENYIDIISMSVGSSSPSTLLETAIVEAYQRGITSVAAAGNNAGAVSYPAAFDTVIAVGAIGKTDAFPENSGHALRKGDFFSPDGSYFAANFSNFGPEIDVCAPGVAILSTVPAGYASWDGTSMACPYISGLAALILQAYPEIKTGDVWQPSNIRSILQESSVDLGLPVELQGAGLPNAELALASAFTQYEQEREIASAYETEMMAMLERAKSCTQEIEQLVAAFQDLRR